MAIFRGKFLTGVIGKLIFRELKGKQIVSAKTGKKKIKHTVGTKGASNTFGLASRLGKNIRAIFQNLVNENADDEYVSRLTGELNTSLTASRDFETRIFHFEKNSFNGLSGFEFNLNSPLKKILNLKPKVNLENENLRVSLPPILSPLKLLFPLNSTKCKLIIAVGLIRLKDGKRVLNAEKQTLLIEKEKTIPGATDFLFKVPDGCLCIVSLFLDYFNGNIPINSKKFNPAIICDTVISPGLYQNYDQPNWVDMPGLIF